MGYIDSHAHLFSERLLADLPNIMAAIKGNDVERVMLICCGEEDYVLAKAHQDKYPGYDIAKGIHPEEANDYRVGDLDILRKQLDEKRIVMIGEIGLDYHWDKSSKASQKEIFRQHIRMAKKLDLPIVIHNREATEDLIKILKEEEAEAVGGVMHCFSGSIETAKQCIEMNFYISIAGPVTFKNAKKLKEVATFVPIERLLIETDCPYLTPHPFRGTRNEPAYVRYVAEEIARIRQIPIEVFAQTTTANAKRLFRIK